MSSFPINGMPPFDHGGMAGLHTGDRKPSLGILRRHTTTGGFASGHPSHGENTQGTVLLEGRRSDVGPLRKDTDHADLSGTGVLHSDRLTDQSIQQPALYS